MKGDVEYAGHTLPSREPERRQSGVTSNLGTIANIGFLIAIATAGTIFCVHLMQRMDRIQVSKTPPLTVEHDSLCQFSLNSSRVIFSRS